LRSYLKNGWQPEHVKPLFYKSGRISPVPEHYESGGIIENNMVDKEDTYGSGKVRMYEELTFGKEVVDLSPAQAIDRAEHFLVGQGYVVVQRTATTLTVEREGSEGAAGQEGAPKVVVMAVPQPDGGVRIKVRGNDREGVQERQGLWKLWTENLPKRQH
jgi:hypothetical protein